MQAESGQAQPGQWWNPAAAMRWLVVSPRFARRATAAMIDLALVAALQIALSQVFGVLYPAGDMQQSFGALGWNGWSFYKAGLAEMQGIWLILIVVGYYTVCEALFSATPGKALLRLRVVTPGGERPSFWAILYRNIFRLVDALPLLYAVGFMVAQRTPMEQRVGDLVGGTVVAGVEDLPERPRSLRRGIANGAVLVVLLAALTGYAAAFDYYGRPALVARGWANFSATQGVTLSAPGPAVKCGPMAPIGGFQFAPAPGDPFASVDRVVVPRRITEYSVGTPQWNGSDEATVPLRLVMPANDSGYFSNTPVLDQSSTLFNDTPGGDVFAATLTLRWQGFFAGGWVVERGEITC